MPSPPSVISPLATTSSVSRHGVFPLAVVTGLASAALLLLALAPLPYGFYEFLRLAITAGAVILVVLAARSRQIGWVVFGVVAALLFNPLIPVTATRGFWAPIDLIGAVLFIVAGLRIHDRDR